MDFLSDLIDSFWSFIANTSDSSTVSPFYDLFNYFLSSIFHIILKGITEGWSFLFGEFTSFIYSLFFNNYDSTVNTGKYAVDRIFSFSSSSLVFSIDMIYFFFGCLISVFVFKFLFNIVLKIFGMMR